MKVETSEGEFEDPDVDVEVEAALEPDDDDDDDDDADSLAIWAVSPVMHGGGGVGRDIRTWRPNRRD